MLKTNSTLPRVAGTTATQRAIDLTQLMKNSTAWHFADDAEKERLYQANNAIRQKYGLQYSEGDTFLPSGVNLSEAQNLMGHVSRQRTRRDNGIPEKTSSVANVNSEQAHSQIDTLFSRSGDTWTAQDVANRDIAKRTLEKEMDSILAEYGLTYSQNGIGDTHPNIVSDETVIDRLRQMGASSSDIQLIQENIDYRSRLDRISQGAKAVWNRAVASIPALVETIQQQASNVEESRKNPEYVQLEAEAQQLENQLTGMQSTNYDGTLNQDYMDIYNRWQDVRRRLDELTVKTPVDQNKTGQRMLREANEAQANATAGLDDTSRMLANTGISIAGNAPTMALSAIPGAGPVIGSIAMGLNAAGQRTQELNERGYAPSEALGRGILSGSIEALTEKIPLDEMANILRVGGKTFVKTALRQVGIESGEEGASYMLNFVADWAANDPEAKFSFSELAQSMIGGGLSGLFFSATGYGANKLANIDSGSRAGYNGTNGGVSYGGQSDGSGNYRTGLSPLGADNRQSNETGRGDGRGNLGVPQGVQLKDNATQQIMNERGMVDFGLRESTGDNASFSAALDAAKENNRYGAFVDSQNAADLDASGTRTFLSDNGMAGAAVRPDGDIVGVFKNSADSRQGALNDLMLTAISNGGNKLDCYGKNLSYKYAQFGFIPVARMDFNPEYATNWRPEYGTPDVIFMMHNGDAPSTVAGKYGSYQTFDDNYIKSLPTFTDYDEAYRYRDSLIESRNTPTNSPSPAFQADPTRVNAQTAGYTPLNIEGALQRLNPASQALRQSVERLQSVYPMPQPTLQTAQPSAQAAQPRVQPTLQMAQPTQQTAQPRVQPTLHTAAQASMDALRRVASPESSVGAAQSNFDPYTHMANEYGTIAPGENPARVVDVPVSTDGNDRVRRYARTAMEAEATPESMIAEFEQGVANGLFSYNPRRDQDSLNRAMRTIREKGFDGALEQWGDVASGRRTASKDIKDDIVLAQVLYSTAAKAGDTKLAMQLAAEIAAEGTRAGQAVQALRLLKRTTPDGKLYYMRKAVDNIQNDLNKSRGDKAPHLTIDETLAQNLLDAKTDADADAAIDAIYDDVASQIPKTLGDRFNAWRYFAMLGNPRTHIRNTVGNFVYQIPTRASNKLSATLQKAFIRDKGKRTRSVTRNSAAKQFAKADYENVKNILSGDAYTSEMTEMQRRRKLFPRPLQAAADLNSKALDVEDQFFKRITYINSMADFLTARGADVNNIDQNLLEQARTHAIEDAKRATFQDASALADAIGKIENKNKATKMLIGGSLPFKRTPINIAKRGFELSPLGLIKGVTYDLKKVKNGTMNATEAIDHISQGLTGTALAALGFWLAENGILSASEPENDKERNFEAAQGSQGYALNIGPYSYTIDWSAPASLPLFIGAEFSNALAQKYDDEEQVFKQAMEALSRLFEPMLDLTMLSGVSSTLQSAAYNQTNPIFAVTGNIVGNYVGQVVPTLLGQVARTIDDTRRTTYADKDSWVPDSIQTFLQRQANKIPGLSQNQPAYTDVWGREDKTDNVWLRAFENFLSPGYIGNLNSSETEDALRALYDATGDSAVLPSKPQKTYTIDGVKHNLTADQWLRLTNAKGKASLDAIGALTKSAAYQSMSDAEKVSAIKDIYDYASAVAANQVYNKELEGTIKTVHDSGIDPGLYYAYKEMEDTLNETLEGYEARDQVFQTIRGDNSLTDNQKNQLYHTLLIKGTSDSQWKKYQEISDTVTAEEYIDAMIQSQAIKAYGDELEEGRATAEATEFSYYLDQMGYSDEKRAALENTFKFYNMFPAEPSNYSFDMMRENGSNAEKENASAIEASGVTAAQYMTIKNLTKDATYTKGETGAKLAAYGKIVSENTDNYDQYAAIMHAMGYKNIDDAYTGAGALPEAEAAASQVSRSAQEPTQEIGINPVAAGPGVSLGDVYGWREAPTEGASKFHQGNDIPAPMGTPVVAYKSGTVSYVGDGGSGGNMVQIDHPDGTQSVYLHLQNGSFKVSPGQTVSQGQQIANVGSTGVSTGPHLDFRIKVNGEYVDPRSYYPGY